jgi:hypothetical protein
MNEMNGIIRYGKMINRPDAYALWYDLGSGKVCYITSNNEPAFYHLLNYTA